MAIIKPDVIVEPFCATGLPGTDYIIPVKTSVDPDIMTQDKGIPVSMSTPLPSGGTPVTREETNGYMYLYSSILAWIQAGGLFTFEADVSAANTGYPIGTVLWSASVKDFVYSLINNNTFDFVTTPSYIDGVHWETLKSLSYPDISDVSGLVTITGSVGLLVNNGFEVQGAANFQGNTQFLNPAIGAIVTISRDSSTVIGGELQLLSEGPSSLIPGQTHIAAITLVGGTGTPLLGAAYSGTNRFYMDANPGDVDFVTHDRALAMVGDIAFGIPGEPFSIGAATFRVNGTRIFPSVASGLSISGIYTTGNLVDGDNTYTINLVGTVINASRPYMNYGTATTNSGTPVVNWCTCTFNATEIILVINNTGGHTGAIVIAFSIEI